MKVERKCQLCGKIFKPTTDAQWKHVLMIHFTASKIHNFMPIEEALRHRAFFIS